MKRRDRSAIVIGVALCVVLSAACVQGKAPGVAVHTVNADIVFGVKHKSPAPPPGFGAVDAGGPALAADTGLDEPSQYFTPSKKKAPPPLLAPKSPASLCPDAALNAFPDEAAPLNVPADRKPEEGVYKWKRSGQIVSSDGKSQTLSGLEDRLVRDFSQEPPDPNDATRRRYSWQTVEPQFGSSDVAVVTYHIDTSPPETTHSGGALGGGLSNGQIYNPVGQDPPNVGEPERGVVIRSVQYKDKSGQNSTSTASFNPTTGLLLLPLPVNDGVSFTSVAIDPVSGEQWQYDATVEGRSRVDACGTIIEGWLVSGTLTVSGAGSRTYSVIVGTGMGGIVIAQSADGQDGANKVKVNFNIGQKTPSPLPPGSE